MDGKHELFLPLDFIPPPSSLSCVLERLNAGPRLALAGLRRVGLTLAARNNHMGARHFVKEELPRIRWANPLLDVVVDRVPKTRDETWAPRATVEFDDGRTTTIDMSNKWSTTITKELMDLAGGDPWKAYKSAALAAGHPVLPGEENERLAQVAKRHRASAVSSASPDELEAQVQDMLNEPGRPKTGAAAILP